MRNIEDQVIGVAGDVSATDTELGERPEGNARAGSDEKKSRESSEKDELGGTGVLVERVA